VETTTWRPLRGGHYVEATTWRPLRGGHYVEATTWRPLRGGHYVEITTCMERITCRPLRAGHYTFCPLADGVARRSGRKPMAGVPIPHGYLPQEWEALAKSKVYQ
jgi:hypothetical protein